jgi:hypothetical protein
MALFFTAVSVGFDLKRNKCGTDPKHESVAYDYVNETCIGP